MSHKFVTEAKSQVSLELFRYFVEMYVVEIYLVGSNFFDLFLCSTGEPDLCYTWGQHHYKTFDGKYFHFPGRCTYKLVADCVDDMFSVHVTNDPNCPEDMKCSRGLELYLGGHEIKVNRKIIALSDKFGQCLFADIEMV